MYNLHCSNTHYVKFYLINIFILTPCLLTAVNHQYITLEIYKAHHDNRYDFSACVYSLQDSMVILHTARNMPVAISFIRLHGLRSALKQMHVFECNIHIYQ
jgi:hypothetical protein